ncbi:MAG: hypothetical protein IT210_15015, partial [Armatimonadetes bacterium]|nr:hypothetical protein [Armatimonadota bacterium]
MQTTRSCRNDPAGAFKIAFGVLILLALLPVEDGKASTGSPLRASRRAVVNMSELARQESLFPPPLLEPRAVHSPLRTPPGQPESAAGQPIPSTLGAAAGFTPLAPSPAPASSFLALEDDDTSIPPDTHGAVGPNHLMVTLNTQVRIQNRSGGVISTVSLGSFWASLGSPAVFDPKSLYDPYGNRWIFTALANAASTSSALLIGVSQTSDPTGDWNLYSIDADNLNSVWVDYPSIGFNKNWIVVACNVFTNSSGQFVRSNIYAFDKGDLYAGGAGDYTLLTDSDGTMVPAITYDNTVNTLYLVENLNGNFAGLGYLRISTISGAIGAETLNAGIATPSTADTWADFPPGRADFAPQLGTTEKIQANDSRMQNVVYRNNSLWCTHTVFLPSDAPTRSAVQWWQLNTAGDIQQFGRIDDPTGHYFYAFPSITVNKNRDALLGYSRFASDQYASANYAFRAAGDAPNTFRDDTVLKAGEAPYYKTFGGSKNRWGDYSNTLVDPVNDTDMWTIQEYAASPAEGSDRWGTSWGRISAQATVTLTSPGVSPAVGDRNTGFTFTVTYTNSNNAAPQYVYLGVRKADGTTVFNKPMATTDTTYNDGSQYKLTTKLA